jgi:cytochrome c556
MTGMRYSANRFGVQRDGEKDMRLSKDYSRVGGGIFRTMRLLALIANLLAAAGAAARAQDQSAATPADAIIARKTLMDSIDDHMNAVEGMVSAGQTIDLDVAHEHADTISVMLMAFPHLFPTSTDQWKPNVDRDPARDTYASPDVWEKFGDFYKRASAASKIAFTASRAKNDDDFKKAIGSLRADCNSCHEAYLKVDQ